jgi:hypothetical protein
MLSLSFPMMDSHQSYFLESCQPLPPILAWDPELVINEEDYQDENVDRNLASSDSNTNYSVSRSYQTAAKSTKSVETAFRDPSPSSGIRTWGLPSDFTWTNIRNGITDFELMRGEKCPGTEYPDPQSCILGAGSQAAVHSILSNGKVLARKTSRIRPSKDDTHFAEIRALLRLKHQHVVQLVGSCWTERRLFTIMYPVAEMNLEDCLEANRENSWLENTHKYLCWIGCLASGLAYIHAQKIKHKDIKPANILILGDVVLFADWGLASDFKNREDGSLSLDCGGLTWRYAAPEARDGLPVRSSSDVFSLGLVMGEIFDYAAYLGGDSCSPMRLIRDQEREGDFRGRPEYNPSEITAEEESFLERIDDGKRHRSEGDMQLLFAVMTAKEPDLRPRADVIAEYLKRGLYQQLQEGFKHARGSSAPTCGKCCQ